MKTIEVKGVGRVSLSAEVALLSLTAKGRGETCDKAVTEAAETVNRLKQNLKKVGLSSDVKTGGIRLSPVVKSVREGNEYVTKRDGFECSYRLSYALPFENKALSLAVEACAKEQNLEFSVSFTVKDAARVRKELLCAAVEDAREKAEILASADGGKLGKIVEIREEGGCSPAPVLLRAAADYNPEETVESVTVTVVFEGE